MTQPFSPAAQAIMYAFIRAPWDNKCEVAAVLRAAAESLRPDPGQSYQMGGIRACQNQLRTIAAELEGQA